jgi:hypothetical protein
MKSLFIPTGQPNNFDIDWSAIGIDESDDTQTAYVLALNAEDDASFCGAPDDETAAILQHPVVAL